ncbi:aldo/keto reductase [Taklimakanibacter lacteus]|uniref:aldo/keto reductase n=1 Tax=Taklimakanibacter lacteus TaxID=2268456 RepID=UPI0013C508B5
MSARGSGGQRWLGATDVAVGSLGFGTVPLGNLYRALAEREAAVTVEAGVAAGIRYFDTAPFYGLGLSERRLGLYLRALPREHFVLSTKIGRTLKPAGTRGGSGIFADPPPFVESFDFSYPGVMRQFEDSLQRLGVDRIDCLVIHDLGLWHMKEAEVVDHHFRSLEQGGLKALLELKRNGHIRAIGAGANELTLCDRFLSLGEIDFILLALRYTLLDQSADQGFLENARSRKVSVVVGAPFQSGILATDAGQQARYNYGDAPPGVVAKVMRLKAVCQEHEVPLKAAALQFPLQNPAVVSVLAGMGSKSEVLENVAMATFDIPSALWGALRREGLTQ